MLRLLTSLCALTVAFAQSSDLETIAAKRRSDLAEFPTPAQIANIPLWLSTQRADGTWPDVNYLSGCDAQRANWPIQQHWVRLITFAAAWTGSNADIPSNWTSDSGLFQAASRGLDWWFQNDYTNDDCIGQGGLKNASCPCGTPGLWNQNWFGQVILIPQLCSTTCLLLSEGALSASQREGCARIPMRAYSRRDQFINGLGYLTGANAINVMQNSVSLALYTNNETILEDSLSRAMAVVTLSGKPKEDGIHPDGSFLQHNGILYNGNYGKDLLNAFIQLEGEAIGTRFAANDTTKEAFAIDVGGGEWMIYVDEQTKQEHWDFNVIGRFVAFPTVDLQASADINFNVTKLAAATADFQGPNDLSSTVRRLQSNGTDKLLGNKGFWASDYMVHRRDPFILTNKMISNRSVNTETTNGANKYGYHMGQGTLYSYVTGTEYRDIMGAWDWNLVPGTTVLLDHPKLNASLVGVTGRTEFVGVVSDGWVGTAVEDYVEPNDASIRYRKAWFFLDHSVVVVTSELSVNSSVPGIEGVPVITVLDNRAASPGGVSVDGANVDASGGVSANGSTLFYGGNGYISYGEGFQLTLFEGNRTGNWSDISTSTVGGTTAEIFSAYTSLSGSSDAYAFWPAIDAGKLAREAEHPSHVPLYGDGVSGVAGGERLSLVFWPGAGESIKVDLATVGWASEGSVTVSSAQPALYLFATRSEEDGTRRLAITLSDPTQRLSEASFSVTFAGLNARCRRVDWDDGCQVDQGGAVTFRVDLPAGGYAGSSVFREITLA